MKFGMMAHNPYSGPTAEILNKFLKIQDGGGCRLENHKIVISQQLFHRSS